MNKDQMIHVSMLNSFNLLTEKNSFDEIIDSGIPIFAHQPDEDIKYENVEFIIYYFQKQEMFEKCAELMEYLETNYHSDGTPKINDCECDYPDILEYTKLMRCSNCNKRLRR